ncbi:RNA polymerase sigma factor [Paenibacillus sp. NEAU-GSW1]|uniref:RNA polymerase sigma factor n=1 Tax=Paenibacillus sp. NEAU-GSW1 TaxID=2682486 RepID=UPI0012E2DAAA|nr:sigma-70 family RNA polymerase sigma factor [Paenibacillus sp. NEAU-GSW1]MUT64839.1 sigma-70 family RNA polymerase sigma factor [Paenibacillus sp. NEAU-GSW1]
MRDLSDYHLMLLVKNKQSEALSILYDRYASIVYSFAWKALKEEPGAREIVQSVFLRLWTTGASYNPEQGRFSSWLLTITRNLTTDWLRKKRLESTAYIPFEAEHWDRIPDESAASPEDSALSKSLKEQVRGVYRHLSRQQIHLLEHFYWQGYSLSELASIYNQPIGTVKNRLHQTLKILRRHLVTEGDGL